MPDAVLLWDPQPADCSPLIAGIFRYWQEARGARRYPARADLDPLDMRDALGNIALIDVQHDPLRCRIRLAGMHQTARLGFDPTGMWLDEMPTREYAALLQDRIAQVIERGEPLLVRNRQLMDGRWFDYEALWLPLAPDGARIDMVLACQVFADAPKGG